MKTYNRLLRPALPVALLGLAACSPQSDDPREPTDGETAIPVEPGGGIGDGAGPPEAPAVAENIPQPFQGVWDRQGGACDTLSEARMEIAPKSIGFYESHGEVTRVVVEDPSRITVSLAMEGEGDRWQVAQMFELSDNGRTMTASAMNEEQFDPIELKKCDN